MEEKHKGERKALAGCQRGQKSPDKKISIP